MAPTVALEGRLRFVVYPRENDFEPPHVHVWVGHIDLCRIELHAGEFMEDPPVGIRRGIAAAYKKHAVAIRMAWDELHRR